MVFFASQDSDAIGVLWSRTLEVKRGKTDQLVFARVLFQGRRFVFGALLRIRFVEASAVLKSKVSLPFAAILNSASGVFLNFPISPS